MFDFGLSFSHIVVIVVLAVVVIGPKDLPVVLRRFGQFMNKMRGMARDFQGQVDTAMKEAGMEGVRQDLQVLKSGVTAAMSPTTSLMTGAMGALDRGAASSTVSPMADTALSPMPSPLSNSFEEVFGANTRGETRIQGRGLDVEGAVMSQAEIDASEAPLMDHLLELRQRLVYSVVGFVIAFGVAFTFSSDLLHLLILPFKWGTSSDVSLISIKLLGVFLVKLKIAMFGGLFVAFPLIATQIYRFIAPGLYSHERQVLLPYLIATPVFFLLGAALVYFMLLPIAIKFFYSVAASTSDGNGIGIQLMPDIEAYLDFVMTLMLAFGVTFQLPVALTLLGQLGVVKHQQLKRGRRFALVGVAGIAALVTPPDPISMITMMLPLFALYEVAVVMVGFMERRRTAKTDVVPK